MFLFVFCWVVEVTKQVRCFWGPGVAGPLLPIDGADTDLRDGGDAAVGFGR